MTLLQGPSSRRPVGKKITPAPSSIIMERGTGRKEEAASAVWPPALFLRIILRPSSIPRGAYGSHRRLAPAFPPGRHRCLSALVVVPGGGAADLLPPQRVRIRRVEGR